LPTMSMGRTTESLTNCALVASQRNRLLFGVGDVPGGIPARRNNVGQDRWDAVEPRVPRQELREPPGQIAVGVGGSGLARWTKRVPRARPWRAAAWRQHKAQVASRTT
jgi:hypothetical protein